MRALRTAARLSTSTLVAAATLFTFATPAFAITWTSRTTPSTDGWGAIAYGGGQFVVVGVNTLAVATSTDGVNWTLGSNAGNNGWVSIAYGGGTYAAVSANGLNRTEYSSDGINWTYSGVSSGTWSAVAYATSSFAAVGSNEVISSTDGINWTPRTPADSSPYRGIAYGNGRLVAVGSSAVQTSDDGGITWTSRTPAENNTWNSVTYGGGQFVAVAGDGTHEVMTSPDGITWTARTAAAAVSWKSIAYGDGQYVAVGQDFSQSPVMTSPDGVTWTQQTLPGHAWSGVTYAAPLGLFVAVDIFGNIYTGATNPVLSAISISSSNASSTNAKVGDVVTVTFTSDQSALVAPTVSLAGHTVTALNTSGTMWAASTTLASSDTEGPISFTITAGSTDGEATSTATQASLSGSNVRFYKTTPAVVVTGNNPDRVFAAAGSSYTDAGATATDAFGSSLVVSTTGSVDRTKAGSYTLTYTATDAAGNQASNSRNVTVVPVGNGPLITNVGGGSGGGSFIPPALQSAPAPASTSTLAALQLQIQMLQSQIAAIKGASSWGEFTRNLTIGSVGKDVQALQSWLNAHQFPIAKTGAGSAGNETQEFGALTKAALAKWQASVGIVPASGFVGPKTRAYLATHH
jgi:hypothetical protein